MLDPADQGRHGSPEEGQRGSLLEERRWQHGLWAPTRWRGIEQRVVARLNRGRWRRLEMDEKMVALVGELAVEGIRDGRRREGGSPAVVQAALVRLGRHGWWFRQSVRGSGDDSGGGSESGSRLGQLGGSSGEGSDGGVQLGSWLLGESAECWV